VQAQGTLGTASTPHVGLKLQQRGLVPSLFNGAKKNLGCCRGSVWLRGVFLILALVRLILLSSTALLSAALVVTALTGLTTLTGLLVLLAGALLAAALLATLTTLLAALVRIVHDVKTSMG
jgi:hypothetical protein